jgi:methenyltetrahydromethanopterin cyclohydrolase
MTPSLPPASLGLNRRALRVLDAMAEDAARLRIEVHRVEGGGRLIDAGVKAAGGLEAGIRLARACLADLGEVTIVPASGAHEGCPGVSVRTDHPVAACMASQYAGWQIAIGKLFAMGSGPMRAAYGGEELYQHIGHRETAEEAAGILESGELPGVEVFELIAAKTGVEPSRITLAAAATRSLAGAVQVVARSVETALHKLHALGFDLSQVVSGAGEAPLPPPARDDLAALGRTNDAVLYGGRVSLWVRAREGAIEQIGPRVPSSASPAHGQPFGRIFEAAGRDFYKIDPGLFSPALVAFHDFESGRTWRYGKVDRSILEASFGC